MYDCMVFYYPHPFEEPDDTMRGAKPQILVTFFSLVATTFSCISGAERSGENPLNPREIRIQRSNDRGLASIPC
jgi:hypothetical protein